MDLSASIERLVLSVVEVSRDARHESLSTSKCPMPHAPSSFNPAQSLADEW
ncbi:hypothetical protein COO91_00549 [Nostoc flagelliforme CCNUN1]|uniref:Uncharacterized protein n=1 Tax=Nostoc flagelliforme CCNUN1 TaxID=2038116 RepID=A0A2K8SH85_9NOSO|nr:hypothetical protein COO91_00549 [Nostoc flagelliforme CCNUN1]